MLKYCKVINEETKEVNIGLGTNIDFYKSIGFEEREITEVNNRYYLKGYEPKEDIDKVIENKKQELLKQLKNNVETHIYNYYPRYKQDNIAIYGAEEERQIFKQFKEYNTDIYHSVEKQIKEAKTIKELKSINVDLNIFEKLLGHEQSDVAISRPESCNPCLDEQPQEEANND